MALMELLSQNVINTTTLFVLPSTTNLAQYLIDRNRQLQYQTEGYTSDTSCVISVELATPTVISNILIQNHNMKDFRLFYDSVTANSLGIYANNSETSHYLNFNSITVSSIQLQIDTAMTADSERYIGEFIAAEKQLVFERNPDIKDYDPVIDRIQVKHVMADGGISIHNIRDKFKVKIKSRFITESHYENLNSLYNTALPSYYVPFPNTSAWNGQAYEMVWSGDFNYKYAANVKTIGYSGDMVLEETPSI